MTGGEAATTSASALRIVVAAERLFALHGIDGVALRQIAAEAGSANKSAVHYHFGSKEGLIAAIFRHRLPQIIYERRLLASRCDPGDLRSLIEAQFLPVLHMAESTDNHYVSFVEQLQRRELASGSNRLDLPELPEEGRDSSEQFRRNLEALLVDLPEPLRQMRIVQTQTFCLHAAADREQAVASGTGVPPFELFVSALLDGLAAFLAAPPSETTVRHLSGAGDVTARTLRLL